MGTIISVGPHQAVVVSRRKKAKIVSGGWVYTCVLDNVQYLYLGLMTLKPTSKDAETADGVPVNVSAVAQCKIMRTPTSMLTAAEHFLGKGEHHISTSISLTLEGHLRAILGTLTVEEICRDRVKFANLVRETAVPDILQMGIEIISFVIADISDQVGYLDALGKTRTAQVKRDAIIGTAYANRDASIVEARCEKLTNDVVCESRMKIQDYYKEYNFKKSEFDKETSAAKAEAALAYELQVSKMQQLLCHEIMGIHVIQKKKEIEVEEKEVARKVLELLATVELPTKAESYRIETIAAGRKFEVIEKSLGCSKNITEIGVAEANYFKLISINKANRLKVRAVAMQQYGNAAIKQLVFNTLPELTSIVCSPLKNINQIVVLPHNGSEQNKNFISEVISEENLDRRNGTTKHNNRFITTEDSDKNRKYITTIAL